MLITVIVIVVVVVIVGGVLSLRSSAKTGMPSQDVLDRASQRARELETREKSSGD
jgi:hypothetical protein